MATINGNANDSILNGTSGANAINGLTGATGQFATAGTGPRTSS